MEKLRKYRFYLYFLSSFRADNLARGAVTTAGANKKKMSSRSDLKITVSIVQWLR